MGRKSMKGDGRGSMPFAVVAVAILLMSTVCGAAMADRSRTMSNIESAEKDVEALGNAAGSIEAYVERGLGEIILDISNDPSLGGLDPRAEEFGRRAAKWLRFQFPMADGGVRAELVSHDISLRAESLMVVSDGEEFGGYTPAYLRAAGTLTLRMTSNTGRTTEEVPISTDGSYALPLAAERCSLFERMAEGDGLSVSQLMSYQLTALAQSRVLAGYGSTRDSSKGVDDILTRDDVLTAYRNSLSLLGLICFRSEDGGIRMTDRTDLADLMAEDGAIVIDTSALYAQALVSVTDDIAMKMMDYMGGNTLVDLLDQRLKRYKLANDALMAFIRGESAFGAESYIENVMEDNGLSESAYRYPGCRMYSGTVAGFEVEFESPEIDLLSQGWITRFRGNNIDQTNYVMAFLTEVLDAAAVRLAESDGEGALAVRVDPEDEESFLETMRRAYLEVLEGCKASVDAALTECLERGARSFDDPFYGAIADTIVDHASDLIDERGFKRNLRAALEPLMREGMDTVEFRSSLDPDGEYADDPDAREMLFEAAVQEALDAAMGSDDVYILVTEYKHEVFDDLSVFDALRDVEGCQPGIVQGIFSNILSFGLSGLTLTDAVADRTRVLLDEILANAQTNPNFGVAGLPGDTSFLVEDSDGNVSRESFTTRISSDPAALTPTLVRGRCVHTVGLDEETSVAFTTVFRIRLNDTVRYTVEGRGALSEAMGTTSSVMTGSVVNDMDFEVAVASGWALCGIDYNPSTTLLDEVLAEAMKILEPVLEPLRKAMRVIQEALNALGSLVMEAARYVAEVLSRIYESIMEPLEEINRWITDGVDQLVGGGVLQVLFKINLASQSVTFEYMGYTLSLVFDVMTLKSATKTLFTATMSGPVAGLAVSIGATVKVKGDIAPENVFVTFKGSIKGDNWKISMTLDPLMKGSRHLVTFSGEANGVQVSVTMPDLVKFHEVGVRLSDVPGLGQTLGSIPVPMLGASIGLDAGFVLRYNAPTATGLLINEVETNPEGDDDGREWIELFNNSMTAVDLKGYTLTASSDYRTKVMELDGTIGPGEFLVVSPTFVMVNESGKYTKNGEIITLKNAEGEQVDKTPTMKDAANDGQTWQRGFDGSTKWVMADGSCGRSNGGYIQSELFSRDVLKEIAWNSVEKAFDDVEAITDLESLQAFIQSLVKRTLEGLIKQATGSLVEASVFVSIDGGDLASTATTGFKVALRTDSDLAETVLKYIAGKIESMLLNMKNPYRIDAVGMFTDNIDLELTFHTGIGFPKILAKEVEELPRVDLGIKFRANLSALSRVLGSDVGKPQVECGIVIQDCPYALIPKKLSPNKNMDHDLWLMALSVSFK